MLQKIFRDIAFPARLLDALFVINIHVQISAALLGKGNALIIDHGCVLNRGHSGANCILDSLRRVRVRFDSQSKMARLIHRGSEFLRRKFLRIGIAAVREHRATGKNFDVIDSIMSKFANNLAHFPRAICFAVVKIPGKLNIGSVARHGARAAGDRDISASNIHAWAFDIAFGNRITQRDVIKRAVDTNVADAGKSLV